MTCHMWGDVDVDWNGINEAAEYIGRYCVTYGRIMCHTKEKYGTVRASTYFNHISIQNVLYPAHCFNRLPKWWRKLDRLVFDPYFKIYWNSKDKGFILPSQLSKTQKAILCIPNLLLKVYHKLVLWLPNKLYYKYQFFIYNRAYQNAIKKWPHIAIEILEDADYSELIKNYDKLVEQYRTQYNVFMEDGSEEI